MPTIVGWADPPKLNEPHLLGGICCLEKVDLGREKSGDINAMSA